MTQDEFDALMDVYLAKYLSGGYYTSRYSGEETDARLDSVGKLREDVDKLAAAQGITL